MAESKEQVIVEEEPVETPEEKPEGQEQEPAAEEEVPAEGEGGEQGEETDPEEKPPSRRESLRIQQLLARLKDKESPAAEKRAPGLDYKKSLEADEDTVDRLEKDRSSYGDARYAEGLEQAKAIEFRTNLRIDAPRAEAKYPILDKHSPKFNPVAADALNKYYLRTVGYDAKTQRVDSSDISYLDFIEGHMELANEIASERVVQTTQNIAKQAATTGLRPGGNSAKRLNLNQAPENMTDEELDAVIAQTIPQKKKR